VLTGQLDTRTTGHGLDHRAGDVQRMSAGRGVLHSDYNPSRSARAFPANLDRARRDGIAPSYEQKAIAADLKRGRFALIASLRMAERIVTIHQMRDLRRLVRTAARSRVA